MGKVLQQLVQRKNLFVFAVTDYGLRNHLIRLCYTHCVNNVVAFLCDCIRSDFFQLIVVDYTAAASLHLCIKSVRTDVFHKQNNFKWFYVCAGRYQCNSNGDSEVLFCS